ncbi:hypothetical protein Y032_0060g3092 [Ancylostoma ceylanicum]|uniref:Uncharacterized protein n=1 Tax=Ancylostoma ceylanicum TaxID=53326 RepID=A0A016U344_9BILA|nr:hypothetical protein Y032_0060g3092 [Ancylostoma ceylanicum]
MRGAASRASVDIGDHPFSIVSHAFARSATATRSPLPPDESPPIFLWTVVVLLTQLRRTRSWPRGDRAVRM